MTDTPDILAGLVKPLQFTDESGDGVLTSRETGELYRLFPQTGGNFWAPKLPIGENSDPDVSVLMDRLNRRHAARVLASIDADKLRALVGAILEHATHRKNGQPYNPAMPKLFAALADLTSRGEG
jgi:hypothetical protein